MKYVMFESVFFDGDTLGGPPPRNSGIIGM